LFAREKIVYTVVLVLVCTSLINLLHTRVEAPKVWGPCSAEHFQTFLSPVLLLLLSITFCRTLTAYVASWRQFWTSVTSTLLRRTAIIETPPVTSQTAISLTLVKSTLQ